MQRDRVELQKTDWTKFVSQCPGFCGKNSPGKNQMQDCVNEEKTREHEGMFPI